MKRLPLDQATTADILRSTVQALRGVRNCLDLLARDTTLHGQTLHIRLRNAVIAICQQTNRVVFDPTNLDARETHLFVREALVNLTVEAVAYLTQGDMPS